MNTSNKNSESKEHIQGGLIHIKLKKKRLEVRVGCGSHKWKYLKI